MPPSWPCSTVDPGSASSDESASVKPARVAGGVATGEGIGRGVDVAGGAFLLSLQATTNATENTIETRIAVRRRRHPFGAPSIRRLTIDVGATWLNRGCLR